MKTAAIQILGVSIIALTDSIIIPTPIIIPTALLKYPLTFLAFPLIESDLLFQCIFLL